MAGKPILFVDFHGTICHDHYWRSLPGDAKAKLHAFLFERNHHLVAEWMRGRHSAETINRLVAVELGLPYEMVWALFEQDCRTMRVPGNILASLSSLQSRYTLILITGNMDSFERFTVPALKLDSVFDVISNSHAESRLKTDDGGALFVHYARRHGIPIDTCLLVDDAADACAIFERQGGTAFRVTSERDASAILADLARH